MRRKAGQRPVKTYAPKPKTEAEQIASMDDNGNYFLVLAGQELGPMKGMHWKEWYAQLQQTWAKK